MMSVDGAVHSAMNGFSSLDLSEEISQALESTDFFMEELNPVDSGFYLKDNESDLAKAFHDYFEWKWICELIKPDYSALYEEIFDRFRKKPDDLYKLSWRKFEEFLEVVFQNNGYRTLLGKGGNDGGVDLRLYTNDVVEESIILVQAKCYNPKNPVNLQAVQALTGVVYCEQANSGLFVTTSRYLPCAEKFAARKNSRIQLASSKEVAEWCHSASSRIVKDKSTLVEFEQIAKLLQGISGKGLEGKIFRASSHWYSTRNTYAMVVKETKGAALLVSLPTKIHTHDGQNGTNLPENNIEILKIGKLHIFRAKKEFDENKQFKYFRGENQLFSLWDGKPNYFTSD